MAGHSKWNNIKNKKGKEDKMRGKLFTKLARSIIVAVREGGGDPEYNASLKAAIEKAKAANMPNDNIERAVKKGLGADASDAYENISYEGYGPGGVAVLVTGLTDNKNRTAADVRHAFDKYGGNLGQSGCVSFMFDRKGIIGIEKNDSIDEDELTLQAIDLGAEDFTIEAYGYEIITDPKDFNGIRDGLSELGYEFAMAEISFIPQNTTVLTDQKDIENMQKMIDILEENDDIQEIYHAWEMPEDQE